MPISKSAKKALRVAESKASLNRYRKARIKEALKNVSASTASQAISLIDKGVKWGIFHKNKAARLKSNLTKSVGTPKAEKTKSDKPAKTASHKPATKARTAKSKK